MKYIAVLTLTELPRHYQDLIVIDSCIAFIHVSLYAYCDINTNALSQLDFCLEHTHCVWSLRIFMNIVHQWWKYMNKKITRIFFSYIVLRLEESTEDFPWDKPWGNQPWSILLKEHSWSRSIFRKNSLVRSSLENILCLEDRREPHTNTLKNTLGNALEGKYYSRRDYLRRRIVWKKGEYCWKK